VGKRRNIAFRWVLPIAEILVCAVLLWPTKGLLALQLRAAGHSYWPAKVGEPPHLNVRVIMVTMTPQEMKAMELSNLRFSAPAVLNIPCSLFGLLRQETVPRGFSPELWRSLTWPVLGIVFWWIAGRSIDALVASRRGFLSPQITWIELFVAILVVALGTVDWVLFLSGPNDRSGFVFPWPSALAASGLWMLLGGTSVVARIVQWRIRSRSAASTATFTG
jgi:hypothetical protein